MSNLSMILGTIFLLLMVLMVSPNVFAINRGNVLRNVALWLAVFIGLAFVYKTFGPESPAPLFRLPKSMSGMNRKEAPKLLPSEPDENKNNEEEGKPTPLKEQPLSPSI